MKKIVLMLLVVCFSVPTLSVPVMAGDYIYRQHINWVKLNKASSKDVNVASIKQPFTGLNVGQMEALLESVKLSKRYLLQKKIETRDIFNSDEAARFASPLVEALAKAQGDEIVDFSVIHKRPLFLLQNDSLTMGSMWAASDGIHIIFSKLFAKLQGDYQASANTERAVRNAKSLRVTLEAAPGQTLSYDHPMEIIVALNQDFDALKVAETPAPIENKKAVVIATKSSPAASAPAVQAQPTASKSAAQRLQDLDTLKTQKLISEQEYQTLRKKILSEI